MGKVLMASIIYIIACNGDYNRHYGESMTPLEPELAKLMQIKPVWEEKLIPLADALELVKTLEKSQQTIERASRQLSDDHKGVLGGKKWGEITLSIIDKTLAAFRAKHGEIKNGE